MAWKITAVAAARTWQRIGSASAMNENSSKATYRDTMVADLAEAFAAHRKAIDAMTEAEYREYKRQRAERYANA